MYFIAGRMGFVQGEELGKARFHSNPRYAHVFATFQQADMWAKTLMKDQFYVILQEAEG